jgi:hypothetical protein
MTSTDSRSGAAIAGTGLAAVLLILNGILGIMQGIAAIAKDQVYAVFGKYVYKFNLETWGWIHLVLGVLVLLVGFALFTGSVAARSVGIVLTVLTVVANFLYLPYQPVWSTIMIALGVFVIWSLFHNVSPEAA